MIRVVLPRPLRVLIDFDHEIEIEIEGTATPHRVVDVLEARYPALRGTLRDPATGRRRPFIRFFGCGEDLSHDDPDAPLPEQIASGREPFIVIGAISGG